VGLGDPDNADQTVLNFGEHAPAGEAARTTMTIYESGRRFEVWRWAVGHTGLLLRSNPTPEQPTRIEVIFKPADAVCLPVLLPNLRIEAVEAAALPASLLTTLHRPLKPWEHAYAVTAGEAQGWVVGGTVAGREDDQDYAAPTMFDGWAPGEGVRTLFLLDQERP
jgi:hypothetical protein